MLDPSGITMDLVFSPCTTPLKGVTTDECLVLGKFLTRGILMKS